MGQGLQYGDPPPDPILSGIFRKLCRQTSSASQRIPPRVSCSVSELATVAGHTSGAKRTRTNTIPMCRRTLPRGHRQLPHRVRRHPPHPRVRHRRSPMVPDSVGRLPHRPASATHCFDRALPRPPRDYTGLAHPKEAGSAPPAAASLRQGRRRWAGGSVALGGGGGQRRRSSVC